MTDTKQFQIRIEYGTGAIFTFGVNSEDYADARKKSEDIRPPGAALVLISPVAFRNQRGKR
jgi:hypothetical protein